LRKLPRSNWILGFLGSCLAGVTGFDLNHHETLATDSTCALAKVHVLDVPIWPGKVSKVEIHTSQDGAVVQTRLNLGHFFNMLACAVNLNERLHINFLIKLCKSILINDCFFRLEVILVPNESEVGCLLLEVLRAVLEHERLEVYHKLNTDFGH